ncbi:hypothetical protein [Actinocrinis puniceicyclus]|nr:hypothetical protein [Actinocrinis puniceicyclus]
MNAVADSHDFSAADPDEADIPHGPQFRAVMVRMILGGPTP